eukprot:12227_4
MPRHAKLRVLRVSPPRLAVSFQAAPAVKKTSFSCSSRKKPIRTPSGWEKKKIFAQTMKGRRGPKWRIFPPHGPRNSTGTRGEEWPKEAAS